MATTKKGIILLVLALVVGVAIGALFIIGTKGGASSYALAEEGQKFADKTIQHIITDWNDESRLLNSFPKDKQENIEPGTISALYENTRNLGKLKQYNGSVGQVIVELGQDNQRLIRAAYIAQAEFEEGQGRMRVNLVREGKQWQMLDFFIDSSLFDAEEQQEDKQEG